MTKSFGCSKHIIRGIGHVSFALIGLLISWFLLSGTIYYYYSAFMGPHFVNRNELKQVQKRTYVPPRRAFYDNVEIVCNFGPYELGPASAFEHGFFGERFEALEQLAESKYFPVDDGYGMLLFFDKKYQLLGAEHFSQYKGRIRWKRPEKLENGRFCSSVDSVRVLVERENGARYFTLEMEENKSN